MTVSLDEAYAAVKRLRARNVFDRLEAEATVREYLDARMAEALQRAFDAPSAADGPPMPPSHGERA